MRAHAMQETFVSYVSDALTALVTLVRGDYAALQKQVECSHEGYAKESDSHCVTCGYQGIHDLF